MLKIIKQLFSSDKQIKYLAEIKLKSIFLKIMPHSRRKNILFILRHLTNGGMEKLFINLANDLVLKYNVIIVTTNKRNPDFKCNVKVIEIPNLNSDKTSIKKIRDLKKMYNITYSISGSITFNYLNIASKYKDKVLISVHNMLSFKIQEENENLEKRQKNIILANEFADKIICVSKEVADDQIINFKASKRKIQVIYNFVDLQQIKQEKFIPKNNSKIIVTVGRLEEQKNQKSLIKSFGEVLKIYPNVKLWILGRGSEEEKLKVLIKKLNLENNIFLLGFKRNIYKYLKQADIFVLTSKYEGFGNVLIEAMACGIPVISTDCSAGPREIIAPDTDYRQKAEKVDKCMYGILIPQIKNSNYSIKLKKEEKNITKAILEILDNKKLEEYYKNQSINRGKDFDKAIILKQWYKIIK